MSLLSSNYIGSRRGSRKCYQCGTYNGNKGLRCRNKECNVKLSNGNKSKRPRISVAPTDVAIGLHISTPSVEEFPQPCIPETPVEGASEAQIPTPSADGTDTFFSNIFSSLDASNNSNLSFNDAFVESMVEELRVEEREMSLSRSQEKSLNEVTERRSSITTNEKKSAPVPPLVQDCSLAFTEWLSSVTERINQTMHFRLPGKPEPLVFHIPESFFDCLHRRMSSGVEEGVGSEEKKRLPNKVCVFVRRDSAPLGKFTIYIWHLYSLTLLSRVFDTPHVQLQVIKYFKQNANGSYAECAPQTEENNIITDSDAKGRHRIAPGKLVTFMKVGKNVNNKDTKSPFTIEWIPNILPITKIGELRIKFEFARKSN